MLKVNCNGRNSSCSVGCDSSHSDGGGGGGGGGGGDSIKDEYIRAGVKVACMYALVLTFFKLAQWHVTKNAKIDLSLRFLWCNS